MRRATKSARTWQATIAAAPAITRLSMQSRKCWPRAGEDGNERTRRTAAARTRHRHRQGLYRPERVAPEREAAAAGPRHLRRRPALPATRACRLLSQPLRARAAEAP